MRERCIGEGESRTQVTVERAREEVNESDRNYDMVNWLSGPVG